MTEPRQAHRTDVPRPVRWAMYEPVPDAEYVRLSPGLIRPDPVLGNVRRAHNALEQEALDATVEQEGVLQAIAIRFIGPEEAAVPVLVWGSRRLRAALAAALPEITVRNLGCLSDRDALLFQFLENDHVPLHPADDALAIARLVAMFDGSQVEVSRRTRRSEATISVLRRVGDALATLSEEEMQEIYASPAMTKRAFIDLVRRARSREELARRLLELARAHGARRPGRPRGARRRGPSLEARPNERGGGEVFTVRWRDADLMRDPAGFARQFARFIEERLERVEQRLEVIRRRKGLLKPAQERWKGGEAPAATASPAAATGVAAPSAAPLSEEDALELERFDELLREADARLAAIRERMKKGFQTPEERNL